MREEEAERYYAALRAHCAGKPGATERRRWRELLFRVRGRVFAFMNSPAKPAVTVKLDRTAAGHVLRCASVAPARYLGCFGWVTASAYDDESLRLACELIDRSYELAARAP
jgi:predicted DNA-binding protein (MmcQ/YjbR family)